MNNLDDDRLITKFLTENAAPIEDDGFTRQVMRRLPSRAVRMSRLWTGFCAAALAVVLVRTDCLAWLRAAADGLAGVIPQSVPLLSSPLGMMFCTASAISLVSAAAFIAEIKN